MVVVALAGVLGWLTYQRNKVYRTSVGFWQAAAEVQRLNERPSFRTEYSLGEALVQAGRSKEGIDHLLLALRADSSRWEGQYRYAVAVMAADRHAEALRCPPPACAPAPGWAEPHRMLGECYQRLGQGTLAVSCYQQALERAPGNTDIRAALGRAKSKLAPPPAPPPASVPASGPGSLPTSQATSQG